MPPEISFSCFCSLSPAVKMACRSEDEEDWFDDDDMLQDEEDEFTPLALD